ncbi:hypothetical protein GCM10007977_047960 [Dactylosporangium sucinum]|uniref:Uncharacterized protein n=1 Tax=Dactylosporangium sucinum TaxID=1424081 RepID=A0A917WYT0_9ACTN|nr:hypothetical protein GCM10007977_047960 [Dactylosporangium sucinum]
MLQFPGVGTEAARDRVHTGDQASVIGGCHPPCGNDSVDRVVRDLKGDRRLAAPSEPVQNVHSRLFAIV